MAVWLHQLGQNIMRIGTRGMGDLLYSMFDRNQREETGRNQDHVTHKILLCPQ